MKKPKYIPEFPDIPSPRQKMPELPVADREGNFEEVELGLTEDMVLKEAARCLSCRRCIGCGLCLAECDPEAIIYDEAGGKVELQADAVIFTSDGQTFDAGRKKELGYRASANVITSFEFERLASPTGPFGGFLLRPFDGDVPRSLAFIQCVGSREEGIGANYCSVECCSRTLTQARRAKELLGDVAVRIFHRGMRPIGKRSELELEGLRGEKWVEFTECAVTGVVEDADSGTVTIAYEHDGKQAEAGFDLVVLAVGVQAMRPFKRFARTAGMQTNKFGFVERKIGSLIASAGGAAFAGAITGPTSAGQSISDAFAAASRSLSSCTHEESAGRGTFGGAPVVYACEYGLELAGKDGDLTDKLKEGGYELAGLYPFLCYMDGRKAMAEKLGDASGLIILGCHAGICEDLFARAAGLPTGRIVILGSNDLDGDPGKYMDAARERLASADSKPRLEKPRRVAVVGGGTGCNGRAQAQGSRSCAH
jgi:ferredoxin